MLFRSSQSLPVVGNPWLPVGPRFLPSGPLYSYELSLHSGLSPKPFMRILFSAKTPVVATRKGSGARTLKWGLETGSHLADGSMGSLLARGEPWMVVLHER